MQRRRDWRLHCLMMATGNGYRAKGFATRLLIPETPVDFLLPELCRHRKQNSNLVSDNSYKSPQNYICVSYVKHLFQSPRAIGMNLNRKQ